MADEPRENFPFHLANADFLRPARRAIPNRGANPANAKQIDWTFPLAGDRPRSKPLSSFSPRAIFSAVAVVWTLFVAISHLFILPMPTPIPYVGPVVLLLAILGLFHVAMSLTLLKGGWQERALLPLLLLGATVRVATLATPPVMETDYYRYLWDGAVVAHGHNPYAPVPFDALQYTTHTLHGLGQNSGTVLSNVNWPGLRTIYPPVAQGAFAAAHVLRPFHVTGLRVVFMAFDVAALLLLLKALRRCGLPALWSLIYWLNPLVIKEGFNSAHVDILLGPLLIGAGLCALDRRPGWAGGLLAAAVGVKVWPAVLLPVLLRQASNTMTDMIRGLSAFTGVCGLLSIPVLLAGFGETSGFQAYAQRWQFNNGLSQPVIALGKALSEVMPALASPRAAFAVLVVLILGSLTIALIRTPAATPRQFFVRLLILSSATFLLSPTQFPWYSLWFAPLLPFSPASPLILYSMTLPMYYLYHHYYIMGVMSQYNIWVVWAQHAPVAILLGVSGMMTFWTGFTKWRAGTLQGRFPWRRAASP